jgi:hypothetical protein
MAETPLYDVISAILFQACCAPILEASNGDLFDSEVLEDVMKKFVIEREIPNVGQLGAEQLRATAAKSNEALRELAPDIQWQETFVTADKTFCIYLAKDEAIIRRHAELSGFPATKITEVGKIIDSTTAE